jgi:hypothetical protein
MALQWLHFVDRPRGDPWFRVVHAVIIGSPTR